MSTPPPAGIGAYLAAGLILAPIAAAVAVCAVVGTIGAAIRHRITKPN